MAKRLQSGLTNYHPGHFRGPSCQRMQQRTKDLSAVRRTVHSRRKPNACAGPIGVSYEHRRRSAIRLCKGCRTALGVDCTLQAIHYVLGSMGLT